MVDERRKDSAERAAFGDHMFRTLFELAPLGMAVAMTDTRRLARVNDKLCEITGYTRNELLQLTALDLTHPDDRAADDARYHDALRTSATGCQYEKRYQRKDGSIIWVRLNLAFMRDADGKIVRALSVVEDVTARVQAETAVRESERRLTAFLDGMPDRAWLKDAQGRLVAANLSEARALGAASVGEILGKTVFDIRPPDIAHSVAEEEREIMRTGQVSRTEREFAAGVWYEVIKAPLRDMQGKVSGLVCMARDISEQKQSDAAMRDTESKMRALLDAIPDRAWLKDSEGRYVAANRSAAAFFGLTSAQLMGKTAEDLFPPGEAKQIREEERQALLNLTPLRLERQFGGKGHWYETVKLPIRNADGLAAGLVSISRDVTARRNVEYELRAATAGAEQANRAKGEFLSHMSHEMRTPMNAILGFAELALLEQPDPDQCEHLEKIIAATKSLLRVVDDVLDFERMDAGKLELESLDFRVEDVLQNVRDVVERAATTKGLALRFKVGDNIPPRLKGDPARVGQVLINLCANAVKFTARGFVEVVVESERIADGRVTLRFEVRDTGIGVSAEVQSRLFQPFVQADTSTTRRYGGTGLGLAICKRLIELMGGRIWIESEPGEGSVMFFTLVCAVGDALVAAPDPVREGLPEEAAMLRGARVLVVDDHPINRMLMAKLLKLAGAEALPAENGVEALRVLEQHGRVDLVLMDLRMPEMDGYEASRRIRSDARWAKLPIVAVTASAATYERARCMAAGMNDVIVKPIHQAIFFPVVAAAMKVAAG